MSIISGIILLLACISISESFVIVNDGQINCGGIICPKNSVSCTVSQQTIGDRSQYIYKRICYDINRNITKNQEETLPNPHGYRINNITSINGGNLTKAERKALKAKLKEQEKALKERLRQQKEKFARWSKSFSEKMERSFPEGFPFNY